MIWHSKLRRIVICDSAGFITLLPSRDGDPCWATLEGALVMEAMDVGRFRAFIEDRPMPMKKISVPERAPLSGRKITLSDLGMDEE